MSFKKFFESKERVYDIQIKSDVYYNEDSPNQAYSDDMLVDIVVDGLKMTWNKTREWPWTTDSKYQNGEWRNVLGMKDEGDGYIGALDELSSQIDKAIEKYKIEKHLSKKTKDSFGGLLDVI
jgi:hypothetical protein